MTKLSSQEFLEAAASGEVDAVTRALEKGADLWVENLSGQNALDLAISSQEEDLALLLLGRMVQDKPDLTWLSARAKTTGDSLVHRCITGRCIRVMQSVLQVAGSDRGALLRQTNNKGHSPLFLAVQYQSERYASILLKFDREQLEGVECGLSPLSMAVREDKESLVDSFVAAGAAFDFPVEKPAWSLVSSAAMMEKVFKKVDPVTVRTATGDTLLHVLAQRGFDLKLPLFKAGYRIVGGASALGVVSDKGRTVFHDATANGCSMAVVDFLVAEGALWNALDGDGMTPLDLAQRPSGSSTYTSDTLDKWRSQAREQQLNVNLPDAHASSLKARF